MSDVLRWVADSYRRALLESDPVACGRVDLIMVRTGQSWVCDETVVDPDELVTAKQIEQRHGIKEVNCWSLIRRYGIKSRGKEGNTNLYRLGDILSARAAKKCSN